MTGAVPNGIGTVFPRKITLQSTGSHLSYINNVIFEKIKIDNCKELVFLRTDE